MSCEFNVGERFEKERMFIWSVFEVWKRLKWAKNKRGSKYFVYQWKAEKIGWTTKKCKFSKSEISLP